MLITQIDSLATHPYPVVVCNEMIRQVPWRYLGAGGLTVQPPITELKVKGMELLGSLVLRRLALIRLRHLLPPGEGRNCT